MREAVEYGQIMESVKMKVSDRKKRGKTGNVQFETLRRNQMAIGCEREWCVRRKGFFQSRRAKKGKFCQFGKLDFELLCFLTPTTRRQ